MASDLSQLQAFLNGIQQNGVADPVVVNDDNNDTAGMSFAELFSHYLAPEVAKLPPSSTASTSDTPAPFTFGGNGESVSPTASTSASTSFDPSTFMPHIPGSPIGTFSPSSASDGRSPMSFPDLDFLNTTDPTVVGSGGGAADAFSIDPSIFNPPAMFEPLPAVNAATPSSFDPATLPTFGATGAPLPPLPSLPLAPPSAPVAAPAEFLAPLPAPSSAVGASLTASGRPKRNVAAMVIPEEEEDEDLYSDGGNVSDATTASAATTSATPSSSTRKSTRAKKPAAKKARSSSTGAADGKKLPKTSVLPLASETLHKSTAKSALPPVPQWADKPDPEEYAKLSSKEKRQLRNKLSARNFRHRRKEYITTLEDEISHRDTLISSLRDEVGVIRAENTGLRTEVQTLKEKWQDLLDKLSSMTGAVPGGGTAAAGLGVNPSRVVAAAGGASSPTFTTIKQEEGVIDLSLTSPPLPPSTQGNAVASTSTARRHGTRSASSQIQLPNLSKDVGASGRRFAGGLGSGGFMSVHTTLVPDVGAQLAEGLNPKPVSSAAAGAFNPFSSQSFNPALNALNAAGRMDDLSSYTSHLRSQPTPTSSAPPISGPAPPKGTFEDFFSSNPYWLLRPDQLDQNRAALYGKLANNAAGLVAAQKLQQREGALSDNSSSSSFLPVPNGFRPAFFRSSKALPSSDSTTTTTTASDLLAFQSPSTAASLSSPLGVSHQDALALRTLAVAATAQQTLLQRMGGAFWEAFSGAPSSSGIGADGKGKGREVDPKKVAAVLSGQARVEVVPVSVEKKSSVEDLGAALGALNLRTGTGGASSPRPVEQPCAFDEVCRVWTAPPSATAGAQTKKA